MITRFAISALHRALDDRRGVPAWVRLLGDAHPPTAQAVADVLEVHAALEDPAAIAHFLGEPPNETRDLNRTQRTHPAQRDPAWWASGGFVRNVAAVAAVFALAGLIAVVAIRSGERRTQIASTPSSPVIAIELPALPELANPLAAPSRAVQSALSPVADPAAALRQGIQRLGEGLESPLRREWSAIVAELDALVRLGSPNGRSEPANPATPTAEPPTGSPSTAAPLRGEPFDVVPV